MIDETTLVRALVDEPPARDDLAMARARQRLREAMERQVEAAPASRSRTRHPVRWVAAVAALVAVAFGLQLVLPLGRGGPSGSAAEELDHLGRIAVARPAVTIPPDGALYSEVERTARTGSSILGAPVYSVVVDSTIRTWLAADGSGHRSTTIHSVDFASAADEGAWRAAGSPSLPTVGTTNEDYQPGGLKFFHLDGLPTDPAPLLAALQSGKAGDGPPEDAPALFELIGTLLAQGNATPALRQGLFEVAAGLDGVVADGPVTDPWGRPGQGISLSGGGSTTQLIVDPSTSQLLATSTHDANGLMQSLAYATPVIVPANSR